MLDLRRLRVLRELSVHGTVTATAAALGFTPSAVSQQLAALERETGHPLLEPAGRGVRLTGAGSLLVRHADAVLAEVERAEAALDAYAAGETGELRVASFPTAARALAAPAISLLAARRPGLAVELLELEQWDSLHLLATGDVDVVLGHHASGERPPGLRPVERQRLLLDPVLVALPAAHPAATAADVDLADLAEATWISAPPEAPCAQILDVSCRRAGFVPNTRHRALDYDLVLAMVAAGLGLGLVAELSLGPVPDTVVLRPVRGGGAHRDVWVATRPGATERPAVQQVIATLREVVADREQQAGVTGLPARELG